jgi:hypothetical protein
MGFGSLESTSLTSLISSIRAKLFFLFMIPLSLKSAIFFWFNQLLNLFLSLKKKNTGNRLIKIWLKKLKRLWKLRVFLLLKNTFNLLFEKSRNLAEICNLRISWR